MQVCRGERRAWGKSQSVEEKSCWGMTKSLILQLRVRGKILCP